MNLIRASGFCQRESPFSHRQSSHVRSSFDQAETGRSESTNLNDVSEPSSTQLLQVPKNLHVSVNILSTICKHCKRRQQRKQKQLNPSTSSLNDDNTKREMQVPMDIYSTIFVDSPDLFMKLNTIEGRNLCLLSNSSSSESTSTYGCLLLRSKNCKCQTVPNHNKCLSDNESKQKIHETKIKEVRQHSIFVPPCVASNAGIFQYKPITTENACLAIIQSHKTNHYARYAKKVFIREVAKVPDPQIFSSKFIQPQHRQSSSTAFGERNTNIKNQENHDRSLEASNIHKYFSSCEMRSDDKKIINDLDKKESYESRIFQNGDIFGVAQDGRFVESDCKGHHFRFYQIVRCMERVDGDNEIHDSDSSTYSQDDHDQFHNESRKNSSKLDDEMKTKVNMEYDPNICYLVSPKWTELILIDNFTEWSSIQTPFDLPSFSIAYSFYSSMKFSKHGKKSKRTKSTKSRSLSAPQNKHDKILDTCKYLPKYDRTRPNLPINRRSTNELVNALLICTQPLEDIKASSLSSISKGAKILHVSGRNTNENQRVVEYAADQVGMRHIHIDGLAAFQYRATRSLTQNTSASLSAKVLGIQTSLDFAEKCTPCLLHICNIDAEIGGTNMEDKEEELQRLVGGIQKGLTASKSLHHHQIIVILSSIQNKDMVSSAVTNICPLQTINISSLDDEYIKSVWSDNETYFIAKPFLKKRNTDEIHYIRRKFHLLRKKNYENEFTENNRVLESIICEIEEQNPFKSQATSSNLIPKVYWSDIGGLAHVRQEITKTIDLPLQYPHLFLKSQGRSGILLYGPPGTGKTLVAKAVATEYGMPFLSIKGPELLGAYVGESEANVRNVFSMARAAARDSSSSNCCSILFFDELDSLAPKRSNAKDSSGGGVMERVVSTFLSELDDGGIRKQESDTEKNVKVFVIGATNRPDLLDPSLLRPGRFDSLVYLGLAESNDDRAKILCAQMSKFTFEGGKSVLDVVNHVIDEIPKTLSGADLSSVASGALMKSIRRLCHKVEKEALKHCENEGSEKSIALDKIIAEWEARSKDMTCNMLTPVVTLDDVREASWNITPSISVEEIKRYQAIRMKIERI